MSPVYTFAHLLVVDPRSCVLSATGITLPFDRIVTRPPVVVFSKAKAPSVTAMIPMDDPESYPNLGFSVSAFK